MKYKAVALKLYPNGYIRLFIDPTKWNRFKIDMAKYKQKDILTIEIKKWYEQRTRSQLNTVWKIAGRIASDPESSSYGDIPENVYAGIKIQATKYGYPMTELKIGDRIMKVPKSFSNEGDITTKEAKILIETSIVIASECKADIQDILDEMIKRSITKGRG